MPLYTYKCTGECGRTDEMMRKVEERDDQCACPTCGAEMVKVPSLPGPPQGGPTRKFYR